MGFTYKNFDLSAFFQGVGKRDGYMGAGRIQAMGVYSALDEHYSDSFNPQKPTEDAYYPRMLNSHTYNYDNLSHWVQNASYLRLKNLQVGYTFHLVSENIKSVRLMLSGQNLFTITKFRVFDPEAGINSGSFPNVQVFSFGLNLKF